MPPDNGTYDTPKSLRPEDQPIPLPPVQRDEVGNPTSKAEAGSASNSFRKEYEDWRLQNLTSGTPVKETSGVVQKWVESSGKGNSEYDALIALGSSPEEAAAIAGEPSGGGSGKWVPDPEGQILYDRLQSGLEDAKNIKNIAGAVDSYEASEAKKTKEITRQFKDFDDRASLLYDLLDDEQNYAMAADDQNIQNWKAQKDLGTAGNPGGFYSTPYQSGSLSSILSPSLPNYVRPDYRLNESVGLPGPQGFDDPDYSAYGLPMYAKGTNPNIPVIPWPWPPRGK